MEPTAHFLNWVDTALNLLNLLILPGIYYLVKIEKRFSSGDTVFKLLKTVCPAFNPNARCPIDGHSGPTNEKGGD